jgi:GH24 family phage-related lysozyme (muramidase)
MTISPTGQVSTGAAPQAPADPLTATMQLLRQKEGLRTSAYYDVNANRVGYGSDTVTLPDGTVQPVNEKTTVTPADAERDLARRSADSMGQVRDALGADVFNKLNPNQVAALTSVAYNYGKVPDRVVEAAKSGDTGKIADAVEGLQTDNKGINADRRKHEANILRGTADLNAPTPNAFAYPNRPTITAPQLPIPGQIQPLQGLDPHAFDALKALAVSRIAPMSTSDRITNVLAGMAGGAIGAKNVGDVLLGAGAGGGAAAGKNIATERGEEKQFLERQDLMKRFQGEVGVREAEAKQQGVNYKTSATNENTRLLNQVKEEQAKLDAAAKNKMEEIGSNFDLQKFQYFMPQAHVTSDGVSVITRKPDGSMNVATTKLNDMKQTAEQIESATKAAVGDKNAPAVQMLKYKALEQQGTPWVKMEIARDMVNNNDLPDVLGAEQYKKLEDEAKKALPNTLMATDPKGYEQKRKDKLLELFWRQKVPDQLWIPKMAERNNFGAIMLMPKAPGT